MLDLLWIGNWIVSLNSSEVEMSFWFPRHVGWSEGGLNQLTLLASLRLLCWEPNTRQMSCTSKKKVAESIKTLTICKLCSICYIFKLLHSLQMVDHIHNTNPGICLVIERPGDCSFEIPLASNVSSGSQVFLWRQTLTQQRKFTTAMCMKTN